ncbi:MAG: T9SS type A sorting domain-containing protein [Bacteroidales bacterium]|nr:T9SS type A sorting domain-containing protein [Bacteroidales bacterium]
MKKIITLLFTLFLASVLFAQTGSVAVVSIPDEIEAGDTVDIQVSYTSNIPVTVTAQLFQTQENLLSPDYNTWVKAFTLKDKPADTNAIVTISFIVPGSTAPSTTLTNRQYTFDFKLTPTAGGSDFGYNNGTADHTVIIKPSSIVFDKIDFKNAEVLIKKVGETITVDFEYTLSDVRNVKAGIAIYSSTGAWVGNAMVGETEVAQYFSDQAKTTTTPVQKTATIVIPEGLKPSALLENGNVYKLVVTIAKADWGWITDKKVDITIENIEEVVEERIQLPSYMLSEVEAGKSLDFGVMYFLAETRNLKAALAIYTTEGVFESVVTVDNNEVAQMFDAVAATGATAATQVVSLDLPSTITPSASLPAGKVYKLEISIIGTDGTVIKKETSPFTVTAVKTTETEISTTGLSIFPQPATGTEVTVSYDGDINAVVVRNEAGVTVNTDIVYNGTTAVINTSNLSNGLYFVTVSTNNGVAVVKLIK